MASARVVLPAFLKPIQYALTIRPDLIACTFTGRVVIDMMVKAECNQVTLNALDLQVSSAELLTSGEYPGQVSTSIQLDRELQRVTAHFNKPFKGSMQLALEFSGILSDNLMGFYRSKYTNNKGEEVYMGVTQFEATDARRAFPCVDEPNAKATFDVTLVVPKKLTALSNMPEKERHPVEGNGALVSVSYERTPIMSTYLLAWAIGEFDCIQTTIPKTHGNGSTLLRLFVPGHRAESHGRSALDTAAKCFPFYEQLFGIDYLLPKCDFVAIPDFAAGAMENWGLTTYRETAILTAKDTPIDRFTYIMSTVCHEIAHQWFGNLVTMDWWNELWLNESFATWCQVVSTDAIHSGRNFANILTCVQLIRALKSDERRESHPISVPLDDALKVNEIFDAISYSKGCSVLRMLVGHIGIEAFGKGVGNYLKHYAYGNAEMADLFRFLEEAAGTNINTMMEGWVAKIGYPVVQVSKGSTPGTLRLEQHRFLISGDVRPEEDETIWHIPLTLVGSNGERTTTVLTERSSEVKAPGGEWVLVNEDRMAFVRVQYAPDLLESLAEALRTKAIGELDRAALIDDVHSLFVAGAYEADCILHFVSAFANETSKNVWTPISLLVDRLRGLLRGSADDVLNRWASHLYGSAYKTVKASPQTEETSLLLPTLLAGALRAGHSVAVQDVQPHFKNLTGIPANIRIAVLSHHIRTGKKQALDELLTLYKSSEDPEERLSIVVALGSVETEEAIHTLLNALFESLRPQDTVLILVSLAQSSQTAPIYLQFIHDQRDKLLETFIGMNTQRIVAGFADSYHLPAAEGLEKWLEGITDSRRALVERTVGISVAGVRVNATLADRHAPAIKHWLEKNVY